MCGRPAFLKAALLEISGNPAFLYLTTVLFAFLENKKSNLWLQTLFEERRYYFEIDKKGGDVVKLKFCWIVMAIVLLSSPHYAGASTVFETTGWIQETIGLNYDFVADTAPFTYRATLSDLSVDPFFGFEFLFLSITTSTATVDSIVGPGTFTFEAIPDETYFANIFGTGGGTVGAGLFGLEVTAVPIPPGLILLGSSLLGLVLLRRRVR
jgi:hypothetical protein